MAPNMTSHMDHHPNPVVKPLLKNKSQVLHIIVNVSLDPHRRWSPQEIKKAWQEVAQEVQPKNMSMDTEAFEDAS